MSATAPTRTNEVPTDAELTAALASEAALADEATTLRGEGTDLTMGLWADLRPLLMRPIPGPFIVALSSGTGKPYASTGIGSVEVQRARMDAVLTPFWWWEETQYLNDAGTLVEVTIHVGDAVTKTSLFSRQARGGVDRASTLGNLHKGTYTNAAKLAFARVGPGHEVYVGAADLDPDTDLEAAKNQAGDAPLDPEKVQRVLAGLKSVGLSEDDIRQALADVGLDSPEAMGRKHAMKLREAIDVRPAGEDLIARVLSAVPADWSEQQLKLALASVGVKDNSDVEAAINAATVGQAEALLRAMGVDR